MILFDPTPIIPKPLRKRFHILRAILLIGFIGAGILFGYRTIFPSQEFLFSFENPDTGGNTLEEPYSIDGKTLKKGRIETDDALRTYAGTVGSFSSVHVELVLENDSAKPETGLGIALRKSYRSFFAPGSEPVSSIPKDRGFLVDKTPYFFSDGKLFPFLSDRAALSWFPKEKILPANDDLLKIFPPEEEAAGFRQGSLLSDAEGVYAIGGDGRAHPIGSTAIFESLGFSWDNVIPSDSEEIRFHKRGKIFLFDAAQPDGTIFSDPATKKSFIIDDGKKSLVESREYLEMLASVTKPIVISEKALENPATCILEKESLSFRPTYSCDIPLEALRDFPGGSFEISLSAPETIHAAMLSITFETEPDQENMSIFTRQIRERFDAVYGNR